MRHIMVSKIGIKYNVSNVYNIYSKIRSKPGHSSPCQQTLFLALSPTAELNNTCLYEKPEAGLSVKLSANCSGSFSDFRSSSLLLIPRFNLFFFFFPAFSCGIPLESKCCFFLFSPTCSLIAPKTEPILCIMQRRKEKKSLSVVKEPCLKTHLHCSTSQLSL